MYIEFQFGITQIGEGQMECRKNDSEAAVSSVPFVIRSDEWRMFLYLLTVEICRTLSFFETLPATRHTSTAEKLLSDHTSIACMYAFAHLNFS